MTRKNPTTPPVQRPKRSTRNLRSHVSNFIEIAGNVISSPVRLLSPRKKKNAASKTSPNTDFAQKTASPRPPTPPAPTAVRQVVNYYQSTDDEGCDKSDYEPSINGENDGYADEEEQEGGGDEDSTENEENNENVVAPEPVSECEDFEIQKKKI